MSPRATQAIWHAAGCPDPRKRVYALTDTNCYWCGVQLTGQACRTRDVCGSSFTDHDVAAAPTSCAVCQACTWTMTGRPPDSLRLWSLVYSETAVQPPSHEKAMKLGPRIHLQNKADPGHFVRVLADPPEGNWAIAVADSGKIHVLPFAMINCGRDPWVVRFEREDVGPCEPAEFAALHRATVALLDAGVSKASIATGDLTVAQWRKPLLRRVWQRLYPGKIAKYRGHPLLRLVLFLARRSSC